MASESVKEHSEIQVASLVSEEPASKPLSHPSPDPKVDSGQGLDGYDDQALSQDPGSQESQPLEEPSQPPEGRSQPPEGRSQPPEEPSQSPEEPSRPETSEEGTENLLGLSFPRKLWAIVEDDTFKSVCWGGEGDIVVIEADLFQREVLGRRGAERIFETDSLKNFIRQLNLYGFSKIRPKDASAYSQGKKRMMIYRNSNFQKDKPGLLENIRKKGEARSSAQRGTCIPTPLKNPAAGRESGASSAKKKKLVCTRCSPSFHHEVKAEHELPQREALDHQALRGTQPFMPSGLWAMSSVSEQPLENQLPQEPSSPDGEGTSEDGTPSSQATAGMEGEGEVPRGPQGYPDCCSVMSLYNTCYSILLAALSAMSPREPPEDGEGEGEGQREGEEEVQEGSSDYKCVFCEQFKDNTGP
ncbi:heat shock transcription factor, X-linked member 3-like [Marmota flaviventris]|uniref:heat shock transcription factor, X-linked member 3-like n=1 Tax=Marmota flaviventris TaxID=93162 RepID=UPI003A88EDA6